MKMVQIEHKILREVLIEKGFIKTLPLSNSKLLIYIDSDMFKYLSQWKWNFVRGYAKRSTSISGSDTTISLHREVMNPKNSSEKVIFLDSNKLNCTRGNMIIGTQKNVREHSRLRHDNTSGYKGINFRCGKYEASIKHNYKAHYLGRFDSQKDAIEAYNKAAIELFGQFAKLNQ